MGKKEIIYSIIIPHHDCPTLLKRLLSTIPKRDDVEVIVVDDKSSEENQVIVKSLVCIYSDIKFIFSEVNGGGGKARNIGLGVAIGKYILFADSDDFFNICINDILDEYKEDDTDMIMFGSNCVDTNTYQNSSRSNIYCNPINNFDGNNDFDLRYHFAVPWSRMVKRDLIVQHNIKFQEVIRHNDVGFGYLVGYYAKEIKVDKRAIYCVTTRDGSTSTNVSANAMLDGLYVYVSKHKFLLSKGINEGYPNYISYALYNTRNDKDAFDRCMEFVISNGYSEKKVRVKYLCWKICNRIRKIKNKFLK